MARIYSNLDLLGNFVDNHDEQLVFWEVGFLHVDALKPDLVKQFRFLQKKTWFVPKFEKCWLKHQNTGRAWKNDVFWVGIFFFIYLPTSQPQVRSNRILLPLGLWLWVERVFPLYILKLVFLDSRSGKPFEWQYFALEQTWIGFGWILRFFPGCRVVAWLVFYHVDHENVTWAFYCFTWKSHWFHPKYSWPSMKHDIKLVEQGRDFSWECNEAIKILIVSRTLWRPWCLHVECPSFTMAPSRV